MRSCRQARLPSASAAVLTVWQKNQAFSWGASHETTDVGTSGSYDADSRSLLKVKVDCSEQSLSNIVFTPRAQVCTSMGQAEILGPKPAEPQKVPTSFIP